MLNEFGLHRLLWNSCDERFGDVLVASPADSRGRGILLEVRQDGTAADLAGASIFLLWRHRVTGERGTEPFAAVDASSGTFSLLYPTAMQSAEGAVDAQILVSCGDGACISSRVFCIRVEPSLVGGDASEDMSSPFLEALFAYERAREAADEAAARANDATAVAEEAVASVRDMLATLAEAVGDVAEDRGVPVGGRESNDVAGLTGDYAELATREWVRQQIETVIAGLVDLSEGWY